MGQAKQRLTRKVVFIPFSTLITMIGKSSFVDQKKSRVLFECVFVFFFYRSNYFCVKHNTGFLNDFTKKKPFFVS